MAKITLTEALKKVEQLPDADYWMTDTCHKSAVEDLIQEIFKNFEDNRVYSQAEIDSWNGMGK